MMKLKVSFRLEKSDWIFNYCHRSDLYAIHFFSLFDVCCVLWNRKFRLCLFIHRWFEMWITNICQNGGSKTIPSKFTQTNCWIYLFSWENKRVNWIGLNCYYSLSQKIWKKKKIIISIIFFSPWRLIKDFEKLFETCFFADIICCTVLLCVVMLMIQVEIIVEYIWLIS